MTIRLASHIHQNRYGIYGFRIVVPKDLRVCLCRKELRISLRTKNLSLAKSISHKLNVLTNNYYEKMRRAPTYDEAVANGKEFLKLLTGGEDNFDTLTSYLDALIEQTGSVGADLLRRLVSLRREYRSINDAKQTQLHAFAEQLLGKSDAEIDSLACDFYANVTPLVARGSQVAVELNELTLAAQKNLLGKLHQQDVDALRHNQKAEIDSITDLAAEIAAKATAKAASLAYRPEGTPTHTQAASEPLSAIVEAYCANQISEGSWTEKTEAENRAVYALWLRIIGDQPIRTYGFEQHRDYKATLSKLPPNLNKSPSYRGKNIAEIIAMGSKPAAPNTINKNLVRISALFEWATQYGYTDLNPARGMTIKNPKRANEERKAFNRDDLHKLFKSPEYTNLGHRHPYQFWVPLIALYTGARLNEICQLHLSDFDESEDVRVIRISEEGGKKRLKTKAARRQIPIHPELTRLGLQNYVAALRQAGEIRLFPELKERRDGYGQTASKWFASYCSRCGIGEAGKVFHSFRHTAIDCMKQADISKEKIAAIVGHEDESVTFGRYGKAFQASVLLSAMEKLQFPSTQSIAPWLPKPSVNSKNT